MTTKGIGALIDSIKEDVQAAMDVEINSANEAGKKLYQEMMDEAKERFEKTKKKQDEEVLVIYKNEVKKSHHEAQMDVDNYKHELVDRVMAEALERLQTMDTKGFITKLDAVLARENGKEKPRISVDSSYYPAVLSSHGTEYQVLEDTEMTPGFVLKFKNYDVDCEFKRLFQYNYDTIVKITLVNLFGEDNA